MQYCLALACDQGAVGMVQDDAKAFKWFKRAADNNHPCNHAVGYGYIMGEGVETNWNRALMYYERGAAKGESGCCFELGTFFDKGVMGLDVDKAEARRYYTLIFVRCSDADDKLHESALKYVKEWLRDNGVDETVL